MLFPVTSIAIALASAQADDNPLLPEGEAERMSPRPVDADGARFVAGKGLEFKS
jgi:hypothetical protein